MSAVKAFDLRRRQHARGASLLEVLVAIVVLAIGMLGVAGMQTNALKFNHNSAIRTQATYLAYEIADAMRANFEAATGGSYDIGLNDALPVAATVPTTDLRRWRTALAQRLPAGTGSISRAEGNNNLVTITIQWSEGRLGNVAVADVEEEEEEEAVEGVENTNVQFVFVTEL